MGRYNGKTCRLLTMLSLTASFFFVEIIVGYITNSIALVADSFHMLSDVVSLIIGFAAVRISKWPTEKNTYGWKRAEVLGALVNAVFLVALCFSILVEALKRLVEVEKVEDPKLLLIVGGAGLFVNIIGLVLFHNHGHSHGGGGHGHGHSHGNNHSHNHSHGANEKEKEDEALISKGSTPENSNDKKDIQICHANGDVHLSSVTIDMEQVNSSAQLNMKGVFLHVLGDALGSVIVVVSALAIWFIEDDWKYYLDPAMSIGMVIIILGTTFPLLRDSAHILLQTIPSHIDVLDTKEKVAKVPGVKSLHEFHVWQLAGNILIASVHVLLEENIRMQGFMEIASTTQEIFHKAGIHSCTVQPEFNPDAIENDRPCLLECGPNKVCHPDACCPQRKASDKKTDDKSKNESSIQMSRIANYMIEGSGTDIST